MPSCKLFRWQPLNPHPYPCLQTEAEILKTHAIPASCSPDLLTNDTARQGKQGSNGEPPAKAAKGKRSRRK